MNTVQKLLFDIIGSSINKQDVTIPVLSNAEWLEMYKEAKGHGVHLVLVNTLKKHDVVIGNKELTNACKNLLYITALTFASSISNIYQLLDKFSQHNVSFMVLKGLYIKDLYPTSETRVMGDVDLYVKNKDLEAVTGILIENGYSLFTPNHSDMHIMFTHPKNITIEIHHSVVGDSFSESQKIFNQMIWDENKFADIDGHSFIIPSSVNHAIYSCFHMINHLYSSGFGLRQLCDLILLINHDKVFEWNDFFEKARTLKILNFVTAIIWICHYYLKLKVPEEYLAVVSSVENIKVQDLLNVIIRSGEFGLHDKDFYINRMLAVYQLDSSHAEHKSPLYYIFPSGKKLSRTYSYAKRFSFLLPIAWFHRIISNLIRTDLKLQEKLPVKKVIRLHKELFNWLNSK